ncbi:MAG TPA: hypothetical protein VIW68_08325 [Candidatus Sulfotelmatobacter sp.]
MERVLANLRVLDAAALDGGMGVSGQPVYRSFGSFEHPPPINLLQAAPWSLTLPIGGGGWHRRAIYAPDALS